MSEFTDVASSPCGGTAIDLGFEPSAFPCVLVLAGGAGSRIGGAKPDRTLAGHRLIDHAIQIARRNGRCVAVGLRTPEQVKLEGTDTVVDASNLEGPVASLAAGLAWAKDCGADLLLTLPCDAPFLPRDLAKRLQARLRTSGAAVVLPESHGRVHPSCAIWRTRVIAQLPTYLSSRRRSLTGFAEHVGYAVEDWGSPARDPFFNVNTPEDLSIAEAWLAQPHFE
jgi:molybdopterin-guanine dinucleotide biosynthesis protein A